jgi:1,5-anhydro-D-fructose reductase (1,5-anhydro-D-mannitol-forming)
MTQDPMRFGIIGFGLFAERAILPAIRGSGNAVVTAIQKRSLDAATAKAREHDIPHAFDDAAVLASHPEVDAVFIVSANAAHADEAVAAAKAGKHVLVEKPMAATVAQAERMVSACREAGVQLMVGHMVRFSPVIQRIKQLIGDGAVGRVTHVETQFFYDHRLSQRGWLFDPKVAGGGPVHDIGVHCLDTIRFLLDDDPLVVRSVLDAPPTADRTESAAAVVMQFQKGILGSVFCSFTGGYRRSFIEVRGSNGTVSAFDFTRSAMPVILHRVHAHEGEPLQPQIEQFIVPNLYAHEVRLFVDAVRGTIPNPIPGEEGLKNQKILEQILTS